MILQLAVNQLDMHSQHNLVKKAVDCVLILVLPPACYITMVKSLHFLVPPIFAYLVCVVNWLSYTVLYSGGSRESQVTVKSFALNLLSTALQLVSDFSHSKPSFADKILEKKHSSFNLPKTRCMPYSGTCGMQINSVCVWYLPHNHLP